MKQTTLPNFEAVWYICYYFKYRTHNDYISFQLMDFKGNQTKKITAFAELAANEMSTVNATFDYVIRVLGSNELTALKPNRVRSVAVALSKILKSPYHPQTVRKNRITKALKGLSKEAREAELDGVYELNNCPDLTNKCVLIVDDIFTFGTSMEAIGEVLSKAYPSVILYGFALAHNWHIGENNVNGNEADFVNRYNLTLSKTGNDESDEAKP